MPSTQYNDADDAQRRLSELRQSFIELKATLNHNIKGTTRQIRKIVGVNYDIDRLLAKANKHFR